MKKCFILTIPIFILVSILHVQTLFADREDEANKYYLDAYNLYKLGKLDQALDMLKKVVETNPDHAEAHFGMGSIYFRQNMFDDAVKEFVKVTRLKPEYVEAYQRLWLAYKKLGMNDKAEEELTKYKKLIEERMQAMVGGSPQVVKPVTPPPQKEGAVEKPGHEEPVRPERREEAPRTVLETRPPTTTVPETRMPETRPYEPETSVERPAVVKPVTPLHEEPRVSSTITMPRTQPTETRPVEKKPIDTSKVPPEVKYTPKIEKDYGTPYIKVDKNDPKYQNLFKPFKKMSSTLFKNPFKKKVSKLKKSYVGKLLKGFIYYIFIVQIWLCVVACFCIYFRKKTQKNKI